MGAKCLNCDFFDLWDEEDEEEKSRE